MEMTNTLLNGLTRVTKDLFKDVGVLDDVHSCVKHHSIQMWKCTIVQVSKCAQQHSCVVSGIFHKEDAPLR